MTRRLTILGPLLITVCGCAWLPGRNVRRVHPGQDLIAAINAASPGHTLAVAPGEYPGGTIRRSGVTVHGGGDGMVCVTGTIDLRADRVVLDGLTWEDRNGQCLEIRGRGNVVRRCVFRRFGKRGASKGIWIREDGDHGRNTIEDCLFEDWGGTAYHRSCIKIGQQGHSNAFCGTVVRRNTFRHGAVGGNNPAIQPFCPSLIEANTIHDCEDGIEVKGSHMVVRNNTVYRCHGGEAMSNRSGSHNLFEGNLLTDIPTYAWQIWTGRANVWRNNVVARCGRIAHIKGGNRPSQRAEDALLINNTFVGNHRGVSWHNRTCPPRNVRFVNNIFVGTGSSAIEPAGDGLYAEDYNLFFRFTSPKQPGQHSIVGKDPQFVDAAARDYHLLPTSPARDAGLSTGLDVPSHDRNGVPRPCGKAVDIGACECW